MRPLWKDILISVWLGMILPGIVLHAFVLKERYQKHVTDPEALVQTVQDSGLSVPVWDHDGTVRYMDLDACLTGVLLAEMPAEFHNEALKAQAVAARTYIWKAFTTGGKHGNGGVCMDPACCQAYIDEELYLDSGGTRENLDRLRNAVQSTSRLVLAFRGELIEATYFSSSGGNTEAALAVWGTDYPYLQSVASPETDSHEVTVSYTAEEFQKLLDRSFEEDPADWFGPATYTEGGGIASLPICGQNYTGVELRKLLGLRSTAIAIRIENQNIRITTRGYGHRVGMSQYGANAMAEAGSSYREILQHYYPGTTLQPI